jgi:hypothetical protein
MAGSFSTAGFLKSRGLWRSAVSEDDGKVITHVFLDGGKATVENAEDREAFLRVYARDVVAGRKIHAVERTVGVSYRMFADLDLPLSQSTDGMGCVQLLEIVRTALTYAPDVLRRSGDVAVCTRSAHDGKIGAHLVWSDGLRVDDAIATSLRAAWVEGLTRSRGDTQALGRHAGLDWDSVIDGSVYRRNGLRMPWSLKRGGSALAAYVPSHVASWEKHLKGTADVTDMPDMPDIRGWEDSGDSALLEDDVYARLVRCSIDASATKEVSPDAAIVAAELASWVEDDPCGGARKRKCAPSQGSGRAIVRRRKTRGADGEGEDGESGRGAQSTNVILSAADRHAILAALPEQFYGGCDVGSRCLLRRGGLSVSSTSRYCQAAGREHSSNHVFFDVVWSVASAQKARGMRRPAIFQRCHRCADACIETPISTEEGSAALAAVLRMHAGEDEAAAIANNSNNNLVVVKGSRRSSRRPCPSLFPSSAMKAAEYWMSKRCPSVLDSSVSVQDGGAIDGGAHPGTTNVIFHDGAHHEK